VSVKSNKRKPIIAKKNISSCVDDAAILSNQPQKIDVRATTGNILDKGADTYYQIQKQTNILENRLDKINQKYNDIITQNKKLRRTIENLRKEKCIFNSVYDNLAKELHQKHKGVTEILSHTNKVFDQKREVMEDLQVLVQKINEKDDTAKEEISNPTKPTFSFSPASPHDIPQIPSSMPTKTASQVSTQRREAYPSNSAANRSSSLQRKITHFEEIFNKVQSSTNLTVEQLIDCFNKSEDQVIILAEFLSV
jgi:seryl-tRNA synthetase